MWIVSRTIGFYDTLQKFNSCEDLINQWKAFENFFFKKTTKETSAGFLGKPYTYIFEGNYTDDDNWEFLI